MRRVFWILFFVMSMSINGISGNKVELVKKVLNRGDEDSAKEKVETKYMKFNSQRDAYFCYAEYEIPGLKSEALIESAKIRRYIDLETNKNTFFLILNVGHDKKEEVIALEDLVKVLGAIKLLKQKSEDAIIKSGDFKCFFVTEDGFEIGFRMKQGNPVWYFTVNGAERKFSKDFDFESALNDVKNKMESLKEHNKL